ncbi:unnamed protein product [Agarophyton chilense]
MGGGASQKYPVPGEPYGGFKPTPPARWHSRLGYAFGVTMWLWVFYRAKQDLPHMLGFEKPWEHHHGDSHEHHDNESTH